jgi:hypothetical protein
LNPNKKPFISIRIFPYDENRMKRDVINPELFKKGVKIKRVKTNNITRNNYRTHFDTNKFTSDEKNSGIRNMSKLAWESKENKHNMVSNFHSVEKVDRITEETEYTCDVDYSDAHVAIELHDKLISTVDIVTQHNDHLLTFDTKILLPESKAFIMNFNEVKTTIISDDVIDKMMNSDHFFVNYIPGKPSTCEIGTQTDCEVKYEDKSTTTDLIILTDKIPKKENSPQSKYIPMITRIKNIQSNSSEIPIKTIHIPDRYLDDDYESDDEKLQYMADGSDESFDDNEDDNDYDDDDDFG